MFESLSEKLNDAFRKMGAKGRLNAKDVDSSLREVRLALLEADVNFRVAKDFVERVRTRVQQDEFLKSLSPGQHVVKIASEELTTILGGSARVLESHGNLPAVIILAGLNGSGKTTTAAKIGRYLQTIGETSMLVAADLHRPAAVEQLEVLAKQAGLEFYKREGASDPVEVAKYGAQRAVELKASWVIIDTAGRFQIDDELMAELNKIKLAASPAETLLVVDSMTGQDAVNVANKFHECIGVTGLVLTKLDGDSRGGAALSIVSVTGIPIKFIGTGERADAFDLFHPDRLASRILGMGDMMTLIEKAKSTIDEDQAMEIEKKIKKATFNLEDFLGQLQQLKNMGPLSQVMEMIPGISSMKARVSDEDFGEDKLRKVEAIIRSMTLDERRNPEIIGGGRRRRIARGSGTTPQDVNQILNQFRQMQKLMKQMTLGKGLSSLGRIWR